MNFSNSSFKNNLEEKKVSIIIPVKGGDNILSTLQSVICQTYLNWECLIIDDDIYIDNLKKIYDLVKNDFRFQIIKSKGVGISDALNTGILFAEGVYIARVDDDDIWSNFHLELLIDVLENNNLDLVSSLMSIKYVPKIKKENYKLTNPYHILPYRNPINHPTAVFKKEIFELSGGYRKECDGFEDYDLWARIITPTNSALCLVETAFYRVKDKFIVWEEDQKYLRFRKRLAKKFGLSMKDVWGNKW